MPRSHLSRRTLIQGGAAVAVLLALGGTAKAFAGNGELLRPPGGQDEDRLLGGCITCDRCRSVCPHNAIDLGDVTDGIANTNTPKMNFRYGYCDTCDGAYKCITTCPTGVFQPFDPQTDKLGMALVDSDECLTFKRAGSCRKCIDYCEYDALSLDPQGYLVVDQERCWGCGLCEYICPSASYQSYTGSKRRGINVEYWES